MMRRSSLPHTAALAVLASLITVAPVAAQPADSAPAAASRGGELQAGLLYERELGAPDGSFRRKLSIYQPKDYAADPGRYVLYLADGQYMPIFARRLDALMAEGRLPKILLVGIWSDPSTRTEDYLPKVELYRPEFRDAGRRFEAHARFLTTVVVPFAEREFQASDRRIVGGYSDGATWAVAMMTRDPATFTGAIALSSLYSPTAGEVRGVRSARLFLGAGTGEPHAREVMAEIARRARGQMAVCVAKAPGGHGMAVWNELMPRGLAWITHPDAVC